ncbi:hypothetical protein WICMUC_000475 [Wickerhamomyces mucosus]|uniref:tRNA A64-2'-O-ribosylphosphate transferase n=1 Tax=Wickerhamomyces mucosus TaxID=1378264 RepID=A0A9P8TIT7_9ASCO|nr:hypothetical protein WICMUC_000475 [Wickerhamomyces mucosus]
MADNIIQFSNQYEFKKNVKLISKEHNQSKSQRSIKNRLHSIHYDSLWIQRVAQAFQRPLVPNKRCGSWYVNPKDALTSSYFKSTDGHTNEWTFSTKRLNFHMVDCIIENNGVIIVDSTRRGKTIPDALSKTIPIWCAVLNYIAYGPSSKDNNNWFYYPKQALSENEASRIINLIPNFVKNVTDLKLITSEILKEKLKGKYLRPIWIHPAMSLPPSIPQYGDFYPVILCCASERCLDGTKTMADGWVYVQGAADDEELWSEGLTFNVFWDNLKFLLSEGDAVNSIQQLVNNVKINHDIKSSINELTKINDLLTIGKITDDLTVDDVKGFEYIIILSKHYRPSFETPNGIIIRHYPIQCTKKGSNELRSYLSEIDSGYDATKPTLILDESGQDLSIGVLILFLLKNFNLNWGLEKNLMITKNVIKQHLAKINEIKTVNPSRSTLQSINSYVM